MSIKYLVADDKVCGYLTNKKYVKFLTEEDYSQLGYKIKLPVIILKQIKESGVEDVYLVKGKDVHISNINQWIYEESEDFIYMSIGEMKTMPRLQVVYK